MGLFKKLFGGGAKLDGNQLAHSAEMKEYGQIDLLARFVSPRPLHEPHDQQRWSRALPQPYMETIRLLEKQGWLAADGANYAVTASAMPFVAAYETRLAQEKQTAMQEVAEALRDKLTSEALTIRRHYEARFPLGESEWSGPDPQLSHSSLTRRIFFLDHWLLDGLSQPTVDWLKRYAAEQHLWGASWMLPTDEVPEGVRQELARAELDGPQLDGAEAAYWKANALALHVDNQETWQRCKGGDHVRRIEIVGPNDAHTCDHCRSFAGKEYLVARVPELPHRACTSPRGCRCRYEPVLETVEEIEA